MMAAATSAIVAVGGGGFGRAGETVISRRSHSQNNRRQVWCAAFKLLQYRKPFMGGAAARGLAAPTSPISEGVEKPVTAMFGIAIVGSGPAGLSAAARAARLGLSHVLLEKTGHLSDTIYKYQKGKHVMATPNQLVLRSDMDFDAGKREAVLANDASTRADLHRLQTKVDGLTPRWIGSTPRSISAPRFGAARIGRPRPTARGRACSSPSPSGSTRGGWRSPASCGPPAGCS